MLLKKIDYDYSSVNYSMLISWNSYLCSNGDFLMQLLNLKSIKFPVVYLLKTLRTIIYAEEK